MMTLSDLEKPGVLWKICRYYGYPIYVNNRSTGDYLRNGDMFMVLEVGSYLTKIIIPGELRSVGYVITNNLLILNLEEVTGEEPQQAISDWFYTADLGKR